MSEEQTTSVMTTPVIQSNTESQQLPHDLPKWLTWGLIPSLGISVLIILVLELVMGPEALRSGFYPQPDGQSMTWYQLLTFKEGPVEYASVVLLIPGILAGLYAVLKSNRFPAKWLGFWALLLMLGLTYFAGEELSWGHHMLVSFGMKEPLPVTETALGLNEQGETNIHNLDNFIGKMLGRNSKNIVEVWCYVGALVIPLILARRKPPLNTSDSAYWFWPTLAPFICAVLVFLIYRPVRLYIKLSSIQSDDEPYWARQSELQEFFIAGTLSIYVCSIAWRLRQIKKPANQS